ncbi:ELWxxDGT repeat protein [Neolewinella sp.]|uniref:ELWxxDGT repeat protein n=1 Tax=Neolewinella sp. TaxID=2993543 RepID=UPI003B52C499
MKLGFYLLIFSTFCFLPAQAQVLVANINQSNAGSRPEALQSDGEFVVFTALADGGARQLYVVTEANDQAELLKDGLDGRPILDPFATTLIDGVVYYYQHGKGTTTYYRVDLRDRVVTSLVTLPSPGANAGESYFRAVGDRIAFVHLNDDYMEELYVTDGTTAGTSHLIDLPEDQYISEVNTLGDRLFITYDDQFGEAVPYTVTDGAGGGTFTRFPPPEFAGLYGAIAVGDSVIVSAYGRDSSGVFITDRQFSELRPLREWASALPLGRLGRFGEWRGKVVFTQSDSTTGYHLWEIDPTNRSVELLVDLDIDRDSFYLQRLQLTNDLIFYRLYNPATKTFTLKRTDGTQAGTFTLLDGIEARNVNGFSSGQVVATDAVFYFLADRPGTGLELWRTDGTVRGTAMVKDIYPGSDASDIDQLAVLGSQLLFAAESPEFGREVFSSDGTPGGTQLLQDVRTEESGSYPNRFFTFQDTLFFTANTGCTGFEMFRTEGGASTTVLLSDLTSGKASTFNSPPVLLGNEFFFDAPGEGSAIDRIFRSDGSVAGTHQFSPQDTTLAKTPRLSNLGEVRGRLLVRGFFRGLGQALYAADPSSGQLSLLKVFSRDGFNSTSFGFTPLNDSTALFVESTEELGPELWRTDGTVAGTYLVKDIRQVWETYPLYHISDRTVIDGIAYFSADDGFGPTLWRSDGTEEGTYQLASADMAYRPTDIFKHQDRIYFVASRGMYGYDRILSTRGERFDVEPSSITENTRFHSIRDVVVSGSTLVFTGHTDATGSELWAAPNFTSPAIPLGDLNAGPGHSYPRNLTVFDSLVYFSADLPELGRELWSTDGTPEGTVLVADINPGTASSGPDNLYAYRDFLYFAADDGRVGSELWKYSPTDLDNDGYTGADDADETDPLVNAGTNGDPNAVGVACAPATDTTSTGVTDLMLAAVRAYPNPTSDWLTVTLPEEARSLQLTLLTSGGRAVYTHRGSFSTHTVPVSMLPAGSYALRVSDVRRGTSLTRWVTILH